MPAGHEAQRWKGFVGKTTRIIRFLIEKFSTESFPSIFQVTGSMKRVHWRWNLSKKIAIDMIGPIYIQISIFLFIYSPSSTYDEAPKHHVPPIRSCCVPSLIKFSRWRRRNSILPTSISVQIIKHSTTWSITRKFSQQNVPIIARRGEPKKRTVYKHKCEFPTHFLRETFTSTFPPFRSLCFLRCSRSWHKKNQV